MSAGSSNHVVGVAFANGADMRCWRARMTIEEGAAIGRALSMLQSLGHVAAYAIGPVEAVDGQGLLSAVQGRLGSVVADVLATMPPACVEPAPAFLMTVWPFDHEVKGQPSSTGRLLGLDLQLTARPTSDEEVGAHLPGRDGLWLIHAQPLG